jgi:hypothetical protein
MEDVVRCVVIICAVLALLSFALIWQNASAPDALKNTGILLAATVTVLLSVLPYFRKEHLKTRYSLVLLFDSKEHTLITGESWNAYAGAYMEMFTNLSQIKDAVQGDGFSEFMGPKGLDIIEKGLLQILMTGFQSNWDLIRTESETPNFHSVELANGPARNGKEFTISSIRTKFHGNPLITTEGVLINEIMVLPPASDITIERKGNIRAISIKNPYVVLTIKFQPTSSGVLQQGVWGILSPDKADMNRYSGINFQVEICMDQRSWYLPDNDSYKRWFQNICDFVAELDWRQVESKVEKATNRRAITQLLNLKPRNLQ